MDEPVWDPTVFTKNRQRLLDGEVATAFLEREVALAQQRRLLSFVDGSQTHETRRPRVFAMEWLDTPFTAGHWVPELIRRAGGRDELAREGYPSTQIPWRRIAEYDPEVIVLMPCGFTLNRTLEEFGHVTLPEEWSGLRAVRSGHVYAVNGSAYFNRPGPRILTGLQILAEIIHPELFRRTTRPEAWQRLGE